MDVEIPKNVPVERDPSEGLRLFIYGDPTIGKTHVASQFPNPIILNTDGNYKQINTPVIPITSWVQFCTVIDELIKTKKKTGYETIVVDLIDELYDLARTFYLEQLGIEHEGDLAWGRGWTMIRSNFKVAMKQVTQWGGNVIFIGHPETVTKKTKVGIEYNYVKPIMPEKLITKLYGIVDLAGYARWVTVNDPATGETVEVRAWRTQATEEMSASQRIVPYPEEVELTYEEIIKPLKAK